MPRPIKSASSNNALWFVVPGVLLVLLSLGLHHFINRANPPPKPAEANGRALLQSRESLYNNIYIYREGPYVSMTFGFNRRIYTESIFNTLDDRDLPVPYTRFMTAGIIYAQNLQSILEIGFGGGRTAWYLHRFLPDARVTSVELDPDVIALSRQYFGIRDEPNFQVVNADGRTFLANAKGRYDIILIDAYRGPFVPFHLLTQEFYHLIKDHLAEGGVVVQNVEPSTMLFDSAVATMHSVFPQMEFYVAEGNVVTVAYDGNKFPATELARRAAVRQEQYGLRYELPAMLPQRKALSANTVKPDAKILTDDFAPVETLKAIEAHNRKWDEP
jgi:spermidine synthase